MRLNIRSSFQCQSSINLGADVLYEGYLDGQLKNRVEVALSTLRTLIFIIFHLLYQKVIYHVPWDKCQRLGQAFSVIFCLVVMFQCFGERFYKNKTVAFSVWLRTWQLWYGARGETQLWNSYLGNLVRWKEIGEG